MYYTSRNKDVKKHVHIEGKGRNLVVRDDKETRERGIKERIQAQLGNGLHSVSDEEESQEQRLNLFELLI